jgi:WS/DGAT/MGAT family acyltransferase
MPRERLSPLDASFLYLDGAVTCNQGVAYQIAEGPIDFERLVDEMQRKVRYVDRLRQSAVFAPFNLFHPTWEFDPEFDIRNHVKRIAIEPAGDDAQYNETISRVFRTPLDRRHPLWAVYVIDGREDGRSAFLVVIHHCVSDGVGFAHIAMAFYDADRNLELEPWTPPREGPWASPAMRVLFGLVDTLRAIPRVISLLSRAIAVLIGGFLRPEGRRAWRLIQQFRRAPGVRFAFNAPLSGEASFSFAMFRLEDFGSIRAAHGGTINDVLLAMVGTALHRYAVKHGIETEGKYLRLLVPSNVRSMDTKDKLGNFVSMAPVLVPLGEMPTRDQLAAIIEYTRETKECGLARMVSLAIALSQWMLSPPLSYLAHRRFSSLGQQQKGAASKKVPPFNLVVTNVPWSPRPSYAAGQELKETYVLVPLLASTGLVCGAMSYNGTLSVTFTGDKATVPDVEVFSGYVNGAFTELLAANEQG